MHGIARGDALRQRSFTFYVSVLFLLLGWPCLVYGEAGTFGDIGLPRSMPGAVELSFFGTHPMSAAACAAAYLSALLITIAVAVKRIISKESSSIPSTSGVVRVAETLSLLAGVAGGILLVFMLTTRAIYGLVDLWSGYPWVHERPFGFSAEGLRAIGALIVSVGVAMLGSRRASLATLLFGLGAIAAAWLALLQPEFLRTPSGGFDRTSNMLLMTAGMALVVGVGVAVDRTLHLRRRWFHARSCPDELLSHQPVWPGFRFACGCIGLLIIFLITFQLAIPVSLGQYGFRSAAGLLTLAGVVAAAALFLLLDRVWSRWLAEFGLVIISLAMCAAATVFVPPSASSLAERYPMQFNAMVVGFSLATALCSWLAREWLTQRDGESAWTTTGRMIPLASRFAFFNAVLALLSATIMAVWPRLASIPITDDSIGRLIAGVGADLLMLLAIMWSARQLRRSTLHILTVLAVFAMAGFVAVRILPFTPSFG